MYSYSMIEPSLSRLTLVTGPMFSGKTKYLIHQYNLLTLSGKKVLVVNHVFNNRSGTSDMISTHDGQSIKSISIQRLSHLISNGTMHNDLNLYDVLMIEEAQFFEDLEETIRLILR